MGNRQFFPALTSLFALACCLATLAYLITLNAGIMTRDLVGLVERGFPAAAVTSREFLNAIAGKLAQRLA